ncbi:MAG: zinc ribbon domain-containing protein [Candidatus Verstraetearchaeota archaeon]|nr:zinc ribbon domain-containing protein [Candidatus Verstraetearchaeota archaeon]
MATLTKQHQYAVAREDLTGLVESLRKLPKERRARLIILSYRRLEHWIDRQCEKHEVPLIVVEPKGTSSTCPRCKSKLVENGYRRMECSRCGFKADRDTVAVLNIERRALSKMWRALTPECPSGDRCNPEQMRGPRPLGWRRSEASPRAGRAGLGRGVINAVYLEMGKACILLRTSKLRGHEHVEGSRLPRD